MSVIFINSPQFQLAVDLPFVSQFSWICVSAKKKPQLSYDSPPDFMALWLWTDSDRKGEEKKQITYTEGNISSSRKCLPGHVDLTLDTGALDNAQKQV